MSEEQKPTKGFDIDGAEDTTIDRTHVEGFDYGMHVHGGARGTNVSNSTIIADKSAVVIGNLPPETPDKKA